jgi:replicative DNA helicase
VIFIHQENKDTPIIPTEFIIGKQRNGPCGTVNVQFNRALTRFESIAQEEQREFGT